MGNFRKIYGYVLICVVILNILLDLLNKLGGISIINDSLPFALKFIILILIIFFPYLGKGWKSILIVILCKLLVVLSIPYVMFMLAFSEDGSDIKYAYIKSPNYTHEIIIKGSVSGLHHFTQHIEVYERLGKFFKKDCNLTISVSEAEDGTFKKATYEDGIVLEGQKKYDMGNGYIFEWVDEDTIEISFDSINSQRQEKRINLLD